MKNEGLKTEKFIIERDSQDCLYVEAISRFFDREILVYTEDGCDSYTDEGFSLVFGSDLDYTLYDFANMASANIYLSLKDSEDIMEVSRNFALLAKKLEKRNKNNPRLNRKDKEFFLYNLYRYNKLMNSEELSFYRYEQRGFSRSRTNQECA